MTLYDIVWLFNLLLLVQTQAFHSGILSCSFGIKIKFTIRAASSQMMAVSPLCCEVVVSHYMNLDLNRVAVLNEDCLFSRMTSNYATRLAHCIVKTSAVQAFYNLIIYKMVQL